LPISLAWLRVPPIGRLGVNHQHRNYCHVPSKPKRLSLQATTVRNGSASSGSWLTRPLMRQRVGATRSWVDPTPSAKSRRILTPSSRLRPFERTTVQPCFGTSSTRTVICMVTLRWQDRTDASRCLELRQACTGALTAVEVSDLGFHEVLSFLRLRRQPFPLSDIRDNLADHRPGDGCPVREFQSPESSSGSSTSHDL